MMSKVTLILSSVCSSSVTPNGSFSPSLSRLSHRYMTPTKEWKDGAVAFIMRNMSKERGGFKPSHVHKWIVLDGDIDAEWIESMNTVMDDNKVNSVPFEFSMIAIPVNTSSDTIRSS